MTLRLTIAPGDHFDFEVKPFDQYTVEEYIRILEAKPDETLNPLERRCADLMRHTGAPLRFVRAMSMEEVDKALTYIEHVTKDHDLAVHALHKVHETLGKWKEEHEDRDWTYQDAQDVLQEFGIFKTTIEVEGKTYSAPMVEPSGYGKWLDLNAAMEVEQTETESYVSACAIMCEGDDGPFPIQANDQSDADYTKTCDAYTAERRRLLMQARWVDVMGCAAFFFSKWPSFAVATGHNMRSLNSLLSPKTKREPLVIPNAGEFMQS